ncbi:MAG: DUF861 domain-containing protein [Kiritimatiellae bacterium]|nr:DUF861 domain-containing protein [Kiritimatiellia bacterium]
MWTKEVSRFNWHYGEVETCCFLEGHVIVETDQEHVTMGKGDFVTFSKDLSCVWDIKEAVKKYYCFS